MTSADFQPLGLAESVLAASQIVLMLTPLPAGTALPNCPCSWRQATRYRDHTLAIWTVRPRLALGPCTSRGCPAAACAHCHRGPPTNSCAAGWTRRRRELHARGHESPTAPVPGSHFGHAPHGEQCIATSLSLVLSAQGWVWTCALSFVGPITERHTPWPARAPYSLPCTGISGLSKCDASAIDSLRGSAGLG